MAVRSIFGRSKRQYTPLAASIFSPRQFLHKAFQSWRELAHYPPMKGSHILSVVDQRDRNRLVDRSPWLIRGKLPGEHDQATAFPVLYRVTPLMIDKDDLPAIHNGKKLHRTDRHEQMGQLGSCMQQPAAVIERRGNGQDFPFEFCRAKEGLLNESSAQGWIQSLTGCWKTLERRHTTLKTG